MKEELDNLSKDVQEYLGRRIDDIKMRAVEEVSVIMGDMLASMVIFFMLFTAFLFILAAAVVALTRVAGFVLAMILAGVAIVATAFVVYLFRTRFFVDTLVKHMCRLLAVRKEGIDE
ncbi:MAG: hypothetical protein IKJ61_07345 [Bacteroidaceae bacterium]|nr:hypothetical protein [Bacteroidaceae bacterium]